MVTVRVKREAIKQLRQGMGLSQEQLAGIAHITRQFLIAVEKGHRKPSLLTLAKIAAALGVSTTELYEEENK